MEIVIRGYGIKGDSQEIAAMIINNSIITEMVAINIFALANTSDLQLLTLGFGGEGIPFSLLGQYHLFLCL